MGLGLVATILTVHTKIPNKKDVDKSVVTDWNKKLKVCVFMPLLLMLISGYGLLGINTQIDFFPAFLPALVSGLAFSSWVYVTDFSLSVIGLHTDSK